MIPGLLRIGVSLTLLALLAWWLDAGALLERLARFDPRWALVAIAISLPQVALLAFPWRFTAGRLGLDLPFGAALQEYYLTNFLNQVLPGGVMGNVSRAWRHGRVAPKHPIGSAARAVILERVSAKVVMGGVAALSFASLPLTFGAMPATLTLAVCGVGGAALVVGTSLPTYVAAARAMGVSTPLWTLLPLSAPVLLSMLVPATGPWGAGCARPRWQSSGAQSSSRWWTAWRSRPRTGSWCFSRAFRGVLGLLSAGRDRRGGRPPGVRDGTEPAATGPGSQSAAE